MDLFALFSDRMLAGYAAAAIFLSVLTALEIGYPQEQQSLRGRTTGILFWLIYVPVTVCAYVAFGQLWQALGLRPLIAFELEFGWSGALAVVLGPIAGAAIYDFFFYWFHRAQHRLAWLWRFHETHHAIGELNAVNSYHHPIEPWLQAIGISLPLSLISADAGAVVPAMAVLLRFHASFIHSSTRLHLGPLRVLICDNRFHRIHHGIAAEYHDRNFGAFTTLWDRLFGTARFPEPNEWPATGLAGRRQPMSVRAWIMQPLGEPAISAQDRSGPLAQAASPSNCIRASRS